MEKEKLAMFKKAHRAAKRRALKKSLLFKITIDDIVSQFYTQDKRCFYSGLQMNIIKSSKNGLLHDPFKMTIDCKNHLVGYTKENIVWCLYCVNSLKQRMSEEEIIDICKAVVIHNEKN